MTYFDIFSDDRMRDFVEWIGMMGTIDKIAMMNSVPKDDQTRFDINVHFQFADYGCMAMIRNFDFLKPSDEYDSERDGSLVVTRKDMKDIRQTLINVLNNKYDAVERPTKIADIVKMLSDKLGIVEKHDKLGVQFDG